MKRALAIAAAVLMTAVICIGGVITMAAPGDVYLTVGLNTDNAEWIEQGSAGGNGDNIWGTGQGVILKIPGVEFGSVGAGSANLWGGGEAAGVLVEMRLGAQDGTLIGTFSSTDTGNWDGMAQITSTIDLDSTVTGTHDLYVLFISPDGLNVSKIEFMEAAADAGDDDDDDDVVVDPADAYDNDAMTVKALDTAGLLALSGGAALDGEVIGNFYGDEGRQITINGVDFGAKGAVSVSLVGNSGYGVNVAMYLNDTSGTPLVTFTADANSVDADPTEILNTQEISGEVTGVQKVILVCMGGGTNVYGLQFAEKSDAADTTAAPTTETTNPTEPTTATTTPTAPVTTIYNEVRINSENGKVSIFRQTDENLGDANLGDSLLSNVNKGLVVKIAGIDFGNKGAIKANLFGTSGDNENQYEIEVRVDSVDGTKIGTFKGGATEGGWSGEEALASFFDMNPALTGTHDIYMVFMTYGAINVSGISFVEGDGSVLPSATEPDPFADVPNVTAKIKAYQDLLVKDIGTGGSKLMNVVSGGAKDGGYIIDTTGPGVVIKIDGVDFGANGASKATFYGNSGSDTGFEVEVRIGSADGPLLGTFSRPNPTAGSWNSGVEEVAATFDIGMKINGAYDVYLVFAKGAANLYGIRFDEKTGGAGGNVNTGVVAATGAVVLAALSGTALWTSRKKEQD